MDAAGPVVYEVTAEVAPARRAAYESYMRGHVTDVLATGAFVGATLERADAGFYRVRYVARDRAALDWYLAERSPALRADFARHFPDGVTLAREMLEVLVRW